MNQKRFSITGKSNYDFICIVTLLIAVSCSAQSFNRNLVILNSNGGVVSVTNITAASPPKTIVSEVTRTTGRPRPVINDTNEGFNRSTSKSSPTPEKSEPCGMPKIPTRMDSVAQFKEWPWHMALVEAKDDLYICGGSLISSTKILTSAHCLAPYVPNKGIGGRVAPIPRLKVRAGEWDVSTNSEPLPHVEVLVHQMTLHPNFNSRTLENDIAVIHLARPILPEFRENILPVCLPEEIRGNESRSDMSSLKRCVVTGWGRRSETAGYSVVLKEIIVPLWENDRCERQLWKHFGRTFVLPQSGLCAGDEDNDSCDGDGGGPLTCFQDGVWVQQGIVSFGIGCGRSESPGVYTRVSSYLPFLQNEMA